MTFSLAMPGTAAERADHFLEHCEKFKLGDLPTEKSHPQTRNLSEWSQTDLPQAVKALKDVDVHAVSSLLNHLDQLEELRAEVQQTLRDGKKVFMSGCGATGRLSLKLEFLWRSEMPEQADQVVGFMAGGDVALIRSIESFEDHADFGERQLKELGFSDGDLMVGITEGGETTFVIGSTEAATQLSRRKPYFIYCNPDEILCDKVERSRRVIESDQINSICLAFGPMALSGSTRMQATTVQLMAMAAAFFAEDSVEKYVREFISLLEQTSFDFLANYVQRETEIYKSGRHIVYSTDDFGMTILTDTTERSPTFSLAPFENFEDEGVEPSYCYFHMMKTESPHEAWSALLKRPPRTLGWQQYLDIAGPRRIEGYDFSDFVFDKREKTCGEQVQSVVYRKSAEIVEWKLDDQNHTLAIGQLPLFYQHLLLKLILNIHSTLVMGRMGRYEGNWMTWVKPSNGKLIDRSIRYIQGLAEQAGQTVSYEKVAHEVFACMDLADTTTPIVIKVLESLKLRSV